ncbi:MAG: Hpt domain-containing protein [Lachnospiraceae bacterium]|nr:Hpt domain-containing protein [Lachnospiraceae bacterium]
MSKLLDGMTAYGADIEGVLDRFMDDEELYATCLQEFVETTNITELKNNIESGSYDNAFEIAHALKGVAGNLGLVPLFDSSCVLVESLRHKNYDNLTAEFNDVDRKIQDFLAVYKSL